MGSKFLPSRPTTTLPQHPPCLELKLVTVYIEGSGRFEYRMQRASPPLSELQPHRLCG